MAIGKARVAPADASAGGDGIVRADGNPGPAFRAARAAHCGAPCRTQVSVAMYANTAKQAAWVLLDLARQLQFFPVQQKRVVPGRRRLCSLRAPAAMTGRSRTAAATMSPAQLLVEGPHAGTCSNAADSM